MTAINAAVPVTSQEADGRRAPVVGLLLEGRIEEVGAVLAAAQSAYEGRAGLLVVPLRQREGVVRFSCLAGANPRTLRREADDRAGRAIDSMLALAASAVPVEVLPPTQDVQVAVALAQRAGCSALFLSAAVRPGARRLRRARRALHTALTIVPVAC